MKRLRFAAFLFPTKRLNGKIRLWLHSEARLKNSAKPSLDMLPESHTNVFIAIAIYFSVY
jgi:hypothetical protein